MEYNPLVELSNIASSDAIMKYTKSSVEQIVDSLPPSLPHGRNKFIYLIAATGFEFEFEKDLLEYLVRDGSCEIHFFDHRLGDFVGEVPKSIHLHNWGLEGNKDASRGGKDSMTLKETVQKLNHDGRFVDMLRIDCDGCEWNTFPEWLSSGIEPRQLLVSIHGSPRNEDELFEMMERNNFAIFHREADTWYGGMIQEYGFLRLHDHFFNSGRL